MAPWDPRTAGARHAPRSTPWFWDELLVVQRAWRQDTANRSEASLPTLPGYKNRRDVSTELYLPSPPEENEETTEVDTYGYVLHTPDFIKERLPNGLEFDLHYGKASNFDASGSSAFRLDLFGNPIDPVGGDTKEYGFSVFALENKLIAKVNFYETSLVRSSIAGAMTYGTSNAIVAMIQAAALPENAAFSDSDVLAALPDQRIIDLHNITYDIGTHTAQAGLSNRAATRDVTAEGVEIEIIYSPTVQWTNFFKISKQETVNSNTGVVVKQWIDTFVRPTWIDSAFGQSFIMNPDTDQTLAEYAQQVIVDDYTRQSAQDGVPAAEQREWRFIGTSKYNFSDLFSGIGIRNFTVGGTLRWEDEVGIGFDLMQNELGDWVSDPNAVYTEDAMAYLDMFVSLDTTVFGKETSFQLYVSDLTNHDDLYAISANEDGSRTYRFYEGRVISLSATMRF